MKSAPYLENYTKISSIDKYFEKRGDELIFIGESLKVYILQRWESYHLLEVSDTVKTIGIMDLVIDDRYRAGLLMLASIEIDPDDSTTVTVDGNTYVILTLSKGNRFICITNVVKDKSITYAVFMEFITRGKWMYTLGYDSIARLFDQAKSMCGAGIPVDHVVLEVIYSHLARDPNNISVQYRHTPMAGDFEMIPLRSVAYATTSTTSRILGSYFNEAINSALINPSEQQHPFEQLLR